MHFCFQQLPWKKIHYSVVLLRNQSYINRILLPGCSFTLELYGTRFGFCIDFQDFLWFCFIAIKTIVTSESQFLHMHLTYISIYVLSLVRFDDITLRSKAPPPNTVPLNLKMSSFWIKFFSGMITFRNNGLPGFPSISSLSNARESGVNSSSKPLSLYWTLFRSTIFSSYFQNLWRSDSKNFTWSFKEWFVE